MKGGESRTPVQHYIGNSIKELDFRLNFINVPKDPPRDLLVWVIFEPNASVSEFQGRHFNIF
ncbi:hypothetical protein NECAME_15617 [Necator americanus]|uniref:Uncharacterized protein n=1 Tax=Necator americanus TaxID=51031 RepID=W2SIY2_NECAM|nr:hypothetical protein NECAME_15617 [Necator americanus]ETN68806.1 hypothetical protein NECAME_15617 [Necator americanus]